RPASARAVRTAGLGHEAVDDAVEDDAVVEAFADKLLDMRHMVGRDVGTHADDNRALRRLQGQRVALFGHMNSLREAMCMRVRLSSRTRRAGRNEPERERTPGNSRPEVRGKPERQA